MYTTTTTRHLPTTVHRNRPTLYELLDRLYDSPLYRAMKAVRFRMAARQLRRDVIRAWSEK